MTERSNGRKPDEVRPLRFFRGVSHPSQITVFSEFGQTLVLCGASVSESVPPFLRNSGKGWLTAEYAMLPLSSDERVVRERKKINGRSVEIQRLIGRSLRTMVDLSMMGERTLMVDCDVLSADGGTRSAAISGAAVAVHVLLKQWIQAGKLPAEVLRDWVAAVSVGVVSGQLLLDLAYCEDSAADADLNLVMNRRGEWIEVQGSAEKAPVSDPQLRELLMLGKTGIERIMGKQQKAVEHWS